MEKEEAVKVLVSLAKASQDAIKATKKEHEVIAEAIKLLDAPVVEVVEEPKAE